MIEVGEYVRTDKGIISKINSGVDIDMVEFENAIIGDVVKHSKNIIDLIEVGDFVNEEFVLHISKDKIIFTELNNEISENEVHTILTHEMYEQNCYKVGEE